MIQIINDTLLYRLHYHCKAIMDVMYMFLLQITIFSIENYKIPPENVVSCNSQYPIRNKTQKEFKECNKTFIFLLLIS